MTSALLEDQAQYGVAVLLWEENERTNDLAPFMAQRQFVGFGLMLGKVMSAFVECKTRHSGRLCYW